MEDLEKILNMIETIILKIEDVKAKAEEILAKVRDIIKKIKDLKDKIEKAILGAIEDSIKWLQKKVNSLIDKINGITDRLKTWIKETVSKIANGAKTVILNIVSMLGKVITKAFPLPFNYVMMAIWVPVKSAIDAAVTKAFDGIVESVTNAAMSPFDSLLAPITNLV